MSESDEAKAGTLLNIVTASEDGFPVISLVRAKRDFTRRSVTREFSQTEECRGSSLPGGPLPLTDARVFLEWLVSQGYIEFVKIDGMWSLTGPVEL